MQPTPAAHARPMVTVQTATWGVIEFARPRMLEAAAVGHLLSLAVQSDSPGAAATMLCAGAGLALRGAGSEVAAAIPAPARGTWRDLDPALDYGDAVARALFERHPGTDFWPDLQAVYDAWAGHLRTVEESAAGEADFS